MTKGQNVKPLTEAQQDHLERLNAASRHAQQQLNAFIVYLRAEHDAPAPEWELRNLRVGFQKVGKRKRGRAKPEAEEERAATGEGDG